MGWNPAGRMEVPSGRPLSTKGLASGSAPRSWHSREEMGRDDSEELPRGDELGPLPKAWKVTGVSGDEVIGAGRVGAFEEDVVAWVTSDLKVQRRTDNMGAPPDQLQQFLLEPFTNLQFWPCQYLPVLQEYGA